MTIAKLSHFVEVPSWLATMDILETARVRQGDRVGRVVAMRVTRSGKLEYALTGPKKIWSAASLELDCSHAPTRFVVINKLFKMGIDYRWAFGWELQQRGLSEANAGPLVAEIVRRMGNTEDVKDFGAPGPFPRVSCVMHSWRRASASGEWYRAYAIGGVALQEANVTSSDPAHQIPGETGWGFGNQERLGPETGDEGKALLDAILLSMCVVFAEQL